MTTEDIHSFETLQGQLYSFYTEMNTLSKKSPNDALNPFKLRLVNSVITKANALLGSERKPFPEFEHFDDATLPSTSDVLVIVSQYLSAFEKCRADNIHKKDFSDNWFWNSEDEIPTSPPQKLKR